MSIYFNLFWHNLAIALMVELRKKTGNILIAISQPQLVFYKVGQLYQVHAKVSVALY